MELYLCLQSDSEKVLEHRHLFFDEEAGNSLYMGKGTPFPDYIQTAEPFRRTLKCKLTLS